MGSLGQSDILVFPLQQLDNKKSYFTKYLKDKNTSSFWQNFLTLSTWRVSISNQWRSTSTCFHMIGSRTNCSRSTWTFSAEWNTFFSSSIRPWWSWVVTDLIGCTILMSSAFDLNARDLRIALKSSWTVANWSVIFYFAKCVAATNGCQARISAFLRNAGLVWRTVIVF